MNIVKAPSKELVVARAAEVLSDVLGVPAATAPAARGIGRETGRVLNAAGHRFVVDALGGGVAAGGPVAFKLPQIAAKAARVGKGAQPLLVVPYMSEQGRRVCEAAGASWIDLSGNARITAPGLRVLIEGRPNRFKARGRPADVFAPKSARVVRFLLMNPGKACSQREIARAVSLSEGFVSRIVARLEEAGYVTRSRVRAEPALASAASKVADRRRTSRAEIRVRDPSRLLDDWREAYRFDRHSVVEGHVGARSGDALAGFVGDVLMSEKIEHAATGLAAAWRMTRFAAFRTAVFFVMEPPAPYLLERLEFRETDGGGNLRLAVPNDAGVLQGATTREGLLCVHPVQAYLDLKAQSERAAEAAARLREDLIDDSAHD